MKINITAGDCLNNILKERYEKEVFIPFCEAMIVGGYTAKLFSKEFIQERAIVHNVREDEYIFKLANFLTFLREINKYDEVVLWFGDEPFCAENTKAVLHALKEYRYNGKVIVNIVDELTGNIKENKDIIL